MRPNADPSEYGDGDTALVNAALRMSTATVSDALDVLAVHGCLPGLSRLSGVGRGTVAGPAYTLSYAPAGSRGPGTVGDYVDGVPEGSVIVIANAGRTDCTVWGEILSEAAGLRGVAGVVIDGVCRDIARLFHEHRVSVVGGAAYGPSCEGFVRISVGTESTARVGEGLARLVDLCRSSRVPSGRAGAR